jgi:hypothetical protein
VIRLSAADAFALYTHNTKNQSYDLLISLDRLGAVIGQIIREWQKQAREETDLTRRGRARNYLHKIGKLLVPESRGKGENQILVSANKVKRYYYEKLFACEQAKALSARLSPFVGGSFESRATGL